MENNCYSSIEDLPIYNWWKIHSTGDLTQLCIGSKVKVDLKKLEELWRNIYDQYIKAFGIGDSFLNYVLKQNEIALLQIRRWEEDDRSIETLIEVAEIELKELSLSESGDFYEVKAGIERALGIARIDVKQCSVVEFYTYIKILNKDGRKRQDKA